MASARSPHLIRRPADIAPAIDYFNAFHDGFIKQVRWTTANKHEFAPRWEPQPMPQPETGLHPSLCLYGEIGVTVVIAHQNYDWPHQPWDREVWATFTEVRDIDWSLTGLIGEPIDSLDIIVAGVRLGLDIGNCRRRPDDRDRLDRWFTFARARFVERRWRGASTKR